MAKIETTTYDSFNRLKTIQLTNGQKLECVYDADNIIVSVVVSGAKQLKHEADQELSSNQKQNTQPPVLSPDANTSNTAPEKTQKSTTRDVAPEPTISSVPPPSSPPSPPSITSAPNITPPPIIPQNQELETAEKAPMPPPPSVEKPMPPPPSVEKPIPPPPSVEKPIPPPPSVEKPTPPPPSVKKPTPPPVAPSNNPRHCTVCAQSISLTAVFCGHCGAKQ